MVDPVSRTAMGDAGGDEEHYFSIAHSGGIG